MNFHLMTTLIFATCVGSVALYVCNMTALRMGDPKTIQLATLDTIRCLIDNNRDLNVRVIDANARQHQETLQALTDIKNQIPRANSWPHDLLVFFISSTICAILYQLLRCACYYTLVKSDACAELALTMERFRRLNFNRPTNRDVVEFRKHLSRPILTYCLCCCIRTRSEEIEMI
uniref:Uncharacterized protein n=1 Tax=Osugoroshi virus TaxID=2202814 RepID=A0A7R7YCY5_9VIRU|nr:hypothetical protein [Osugoroshi virus]